MNERNRKKQPALRLIALESALSALLLWLSQPPLGWWPLALVAIVPLIRIISAPSPLPKRGYLVIWAMMSLYWLVSLQGLRHAHWAMHFCWIALAGYLAIYPVLFVFAARSILTRYKATLFLVIGVLWVGQECLRNYMLTGISACMLGHAFAEVPIAIQITDLFGTYGVSFVIAAANAVVYLLVITAKERTAVKGLGLNLASVVVLLGGTILYGRVALDREPGPVLANFALVQRSEPVEYAQSMEREVDIFRDYAADTIDEVAKSAVRIDAVVWPESMFTGGNPWMMIAEGADLSAVPTTSGLSPEEIRVGVGESQTLFMQRSTHLLNAIRASKPTDPPPRLIVGCGVVRYGDFPGIYSGVINISPRGEVEDWYGKTHLVMFGEYIPLISWIPGLRSLAPAGLGVQVGPGPRAFAVGEQVIAPNICIETAVERVAVNQMRELASSQQAPAAIVTVTNDGWFDNSSVIQHHLRCAQFVAIGCRRPLLSAANNGPTVWIDSNGVVKGEVPQGTDGVLIASPTQDTRNSLYVQIGDWPARLCALSMLIAMGFGFRRRQEVKS